jgi:hypothetical protein
MCYISPPSSFGRVVLARAEERELRVAAGPADESLIGEYGRAACVL